MILGSTLKKVRVKNLAYGLFFNNLLALFRMKTTISEAFSFQTVGTGNDNESSYSSAMHY